MFISRFSQTLFKKSLFLSNQSKFGKILKASTSRLQTTKQQKFTNNIQKASKLFKLQISRKLSQNKNEISQEQFIKSLANFQLNKFSMRLHTNDITSQKALEMLQKLKKQEIFENCLQIIIRQKQLTHTGQKYLTNFFMIGLKLYKKVCRDFKQLKHKIDLQFFKFFVLKFNQYYMLLQNDKYLALDYMYLLNFCLDNKLIDSNKSHFINQKILIDSIIDDGFEFRNNEIYRVISYLAAADVGAHYSQRILQLMQKILEQLPDRWYATIDQKHLVFTMKNFKRIGHIHSKITIALSYLLQKAKSLITFVNALMFYMDLNAQNFFQKNTDKNFQKLTQKLLNYMQKAKENQIFISYLLIVPYFYRAGIWNERFWLGFASWFQTGNNYKDVKIIHLYTIFQLIEIDHDVIPSAVKSRLQQTRNKLLLEKSFDIKSVDLVKEYYKQFNTHIKTNMSVQKQITNNLRSVSQQNVKSQVLVKFFLVDIMVNDELIIQINSSMHYYFDIQNDRRFHNLKSLFRERVLKKLGYKYIQVDVQDFTQGNIQFLNKFQKEYLKANSVQ